MAGLPELNPALDDKDDVRQLLEVVTEPHLIEPVGKEQPGKRDAVNPGYIFANLVLVKE